MMFAVARTSPSQAAATASGSISATAPAGASLTPSAIAAACRPEIAPAASAAAVFGSTPDRRVRAVRTVRAASPGVWCPRRSHPRAGRQGAVQGVGAVGVDPPDQRQGQRVGLAGQDPQLVQQGGGLVVAEVLDALVQGAGQRGVGGRDVRLDSRVCIVEHMFE